MDNTYYMQKINYETKSVHWPPVKNSEKALYKQSVDYVDDPRVKLSYCTCPEGLKSKKWLWMFHPPFTQNPVQQNYSASSGAADTSRGVSPHETFWKHTERKFTKSDARWLSHLL